jgi:drug/metabolite transporter (DMT)-like permease
MSSASRHNPLKGVILILAAVLLFASMDTAGKHLMTKYNVPLVASIRYGLNAVFLLALLAPTKGKALWQSNRRALVFLRGGALALATFCMGLALQRMPLGETVAIIYLQGFGVMLTAGYFLKERISWVAWICAGIGFAGVLLMARPGGALDPLGVLFALSAAAVSVIYILLSRSLTTTENTISMLFHSALVGVAFFGLLLAFQWQSYRFELLDLALLFYMGAISLAAHYLHTSAYRFAPASMLAPFNYFHIAFAAIFGWLVYHHIPDHLALIGMAMIGIAGAAVALHGHRNTASR